MAAAEALDAPVRDSVLSGLDRVAQLAPGHGFADITAGVNDAFGGGLDAFVEGDVGWKPWENAELFGFAKANLAGVQAGVGARLTF